MKLALASDLYIDCYPDDQRIDWRLARRWTGVDVLVIGGNISASPERAKREVLAARKAFDCVIFVDGNPEHQTGLPIPDGLETLRQFAARNDGVHYLNGEAGVRVGHTMVCGVAGWQEHQAALLARRVREAAADQTVGEIVVVTHAAPHPDGLGFTGDETAGGTSGALASAALLPIWSECLDGGKLTVWCFGHAPHPLDFTDSGVRFVCNPRGRPGKGATTPYSVHLIDTAALTGDEWGTVL
jgi:hypothetical protein